MLVDHYGIQEPNIYQFEAFLKPVFLKDKDVFGSSMKPARSLWLTNVEIYKAIGVRVLSQCIKGIQRIRDMWRIYMDNEEDRLSLLVQGLVLRGRQIPLHSQKLVLYHVNSGSIAQFEHHLIVHSNIDYL
jgi:hypothetical protein